MADFKIGDRVKIVHSNIRDCKVWQIGTIINERNGQTAKLFNVQVDGAPAEFGIWTTKEGMIHYGNKES